MHGHGRETNLHDGGYHQCVAASTIDMSRFERETESSKLGHLVDDNNELLNPDDTTMRVLNGGARCIPQWGQCGGFFFEPFLRGPERLPCCPSPGDDTLVDDARNVSSTRQGSIDRSHGLSTFLSPV